MIPVFKFINTSLLFFEHQIVQPLRIQQEKIVIASATIFSLITGCTLIYRHFFRVTHKHPPTRNVNLPLALQENIHKHKLQNLILHIDVNRTINADDSAAGWTLQDILAMLLAENYVAKWQGKEMTFHEYVCSLIPGSHNGPIKKQRQAILKDFIYLLKESSFQKDSTIDFTKLKENQNDSIESVKQKIAQAKSFVLTSLMILKQENEQAFETLKDYG
jgi:hypothetical protein